ncbi:hypothetical protein ROZALSC1DRAFT_28911 [Rozella allomycis CSF55]|uniref:Uncharacterized protein n=1 Tax=Rozella allomycis (strain CSF55) TaxID=988480 RepID=A0A075AQ28_ROZAC|nr:hypothetical protein O9G_002587 [Rozella allomycis CSF55]RKP19498.1 hypothetical protein ROZALSC1DRAFT_28911 [Rozella allomycis CSF55]|eukprot:EPZ32235.1 hypothetical protein O9G_002587 [Rozella allomycis CSF55]
MRSSTRIILGVVFVITIIALDIFVLIAVTSYKDVTKVPKRNLHKYFENNEYQYLNNLNVTGQTKKSPGVNIVLADGIENPSKTFCLDLNILVENSKMYFLLPKGFNQQDTKIIAFKLFDRDPSKIVCALKLSDGLHIIELIEKSFPMCIISIESLHDEEMPIWIQDKSSVPARIRPVTKQIKSSYRLPSIATLNVKPHGKCVVRVLDSLEHDEIFNKEFIS